MPVMQIKSGNSAYVERIWWDNRIHISGNYNPEILQFADRTWHGAEGKTDISSVRYISFLDFDITQLKGKIINNAKLKIYISGVSSKALMWVAGTSSSQDLEDMIKSDPKSQLRDRISPAILDSSYVGKYLTIENIKPFLDKMVDGTYPKPRFALYGPDNYTYMGTISAHSFGATNPPILEVDYSYVKPEKPNDLQMKYDPITGEIEASWKFEGLDEDDVQTGYNIQYSYNQTNWTTISKNTAVSKHIFPIGTFQSGVIYWRLQSKSSYGGISEWSDTEEFLFSGYQTGKPIVVSPAGNIVTDTDVEFKWQYNPSGAWDKQTRYELQYSLDGSVWKTIFANNANTSVVVPKSEFQSGTVWWRVRVRNNYNYMSQWSTTTTFTYAGKPKAPVIISGTSFSIANVTVEWVSTEQVAYQLKILDSGNVVVDTGEVTTATQKKYSRVLENNKTYTVQVRIKNQFGLWSDYTTQTITVNFELPAKPLMYLLASEKRGSIEVKIINGDGGAAFLENEVYRRKVGSLEWEKVAKGIGKNQTFTDYTVVSEDEYEYKVRTIGDTLGYNDSDSDTIKVKVRNTQLTNTENPEEWVELIYNPSRSQKIKYDEHLMRFAGRKKATVERGDFEEINISYSFTILGYNNLQKLINLINKRETILLRDSRKRRMYVTIDNLQVEEDYKKNRYNVSFSATEVDFEVML